MHVGDLVWDVLFRGMAILTPTERWRAAGTGSRDSAAGQMADYLLPVLAAVVLVFLILALWWVMHRQRPARRKTARDRTQSGRPDSRAGRPEARRRCRPGS